MLARQEKEWAMDEIRSKIKGTSQAAFVALLVLAAALAMVAAATLATYLGLSLIHI